MLSLSFIDQSGLKQSTKNEWFTATPWRGKTTRTFPFFGKETQLISSSHYYSSYFWQAVFPSEGLCSLPRFRCFSGTCEQRPFQQISLLQQFQRAFQGSYISHHFPVTVSIWHSWDIACFPSTQLSVFLWNNTFPPFNSGKLFCAECKSYVKVHHKTRPQVPPRVSVM